MSVYSLAERALAPLLERLPAPPLEITHRMLRIPELDPRLDGFTIGQVSDLHIGEHGWQPDHFDDAVAALRAGNPDLVINCGDFIEGDPPLDRVIQFARELTAPRAGRTIAVLGNHDYAAGEPDVRRLTDALAKAGIRVLQNEAECVHADESSVSVVGLTRAAPGWDAAVVRLKCADRPRIAVLHEPDNAELLPRGAADLVLAGHTHGGQIAIPGLEPPIVRKFSGSDYFRGMYRVNGSPVYVSRGLGYVGIRFRFRSPPEVAFFTLARAEVQIRARQLTEE